MFQVEHFSEDNFSTLSAANVLLPSVSPWQLEHKAQHFFRQAKRWATSISISSPWVPAGL